MSTRAHDDTAAVGGKLNTTAVKVMVVISVLWFAVVVYRFAVGIGPVSALNDGYSWGAWKIFNVIVLTALASGGYATATAIYALNRGKYHPLIRTAIATSALGYTTALIALAIDVGRPWNMWRMVDITQWNVHSVLLEVAVCVTLYGGFLWLEMSYPAMEAVEKSKKESRLKRWSRRARPYMEKAYPFIVATAIFLPTLHQSSLGSLFLLAGPRLHPLYQSAFLPFFFLVAAFAMGFAAVIGVSLISSLVWKTPYQTPMLTKIERIMGGLLLILAASRWIEWAVAGELGMALAFDGYSLLVLLETALMVAPGIWIFAHKARGARDLYLAAGGAAVGGMLYRLDASLIAFRPDARYSYFPSLLELFLTFGLIVLAVLGYILFVKALPILPSRRPVVEEG